MGGLSGDDASEDTTRTVGGDKTRTRILTSDEVEMRQMRTHEMRR